MKSTLALLIATFFYAGYFPIAPGTIGTAVGILIYLGVHNFPLWAYSLFTLIFFLISTWAAHQAAISLQEKDPSKIIIDETVSFLITMFLIPFSLKTIAIGFILNRFFDITKIYPANLIDRKMQGGIGIMLDDIVAGIYSNIVLHLLLFIFPKLLYV